MEGLTIVLLVIFTSCMERIYVHDPMVVMQAARVLQGGGVVMHPTETCYGLAVDIFNEDALNKVYALKGRDADKPCSILVSSLAMAEKFGVFSDKAIELAGRYWPGPLSLVLPRTEELPDYLNPGNKFISIRFSDDAFCGELVKAFGRPVTTTSANVSGMPPMYSPDVESFGEKSKKIDLLVDGGDLKGESPSTVVKVDGQKIEILRRGGLKITK
jgi:L-threonylcarbamoyladenylate synthase